MHRLSNPPANFSRWLKKLRTQQDLTQEALAEHAYCSVQTIRFFETGKRRPSLEMAERLAQVLKVPAEQQEEFYRLARQSIEKPEVVAEEEPVADSPVQPVHKLPLPQATTPLVGREGEQNILIHLLQQDKHRLVTLVGVGGMGKTRLALETANAVAADYADGVAFVALAPLQSAGQLPEAVAEVLEIPLKGSGDPAEQVLSWLATRHLLLVLDNFEQKLYLDRHWSSRGGRPLVRHGFGLVLLPRRGPGTGERKAGSDAGAAFAGHGDGACGGHHTLSTYCP